MAMKRGVFAGLGVLAASLLLASSAGAVTVLGYDLESGVFGGQLGVHAAGTQTGVSTADAYVNQDGSSVTYTSTGLFNLDLNGQGEATIDGDPTLNNLTVTFGKTWGSVTFDLETQTQTPSTMTLLVNGVALFSDGVCGALCTLGNGSNKFVLTGPDIQTLTFNFTPDIADAKQFRLELPGTVPEPATWTMMILGVGMIGAVLRKRRAMVWTAT
jgi:hypothetical protein